MAVLADEQAQWKPNAYAFTVLGCEHSLKFPVIKLTDFHDKVEELLAEEEARLFLNRLRGGEQVLRYYQDCLIFRNYSA
jgi:hypothetical protein